MTLKKLKSLITLTPEQFAKLCSYKSITAETFNDGVKTTHSGVHATYRLDERSEVWRLVSIH